MMPMPRLSWAAPPISCMAETNSVARPTSSCGITHAAIRNPSRPATELNTEVNVRASESLDPSSRGRPDGSERGTAATLREPRGEWPTGHTCSSEHSPRAICARNTASNGLLGSSSSESTNTTTIRPS